MEFWITKEEIDEHGRIIVNNAWIEKDDFSIVRAEQEGEDLLIAVSLSEGSEEKIMRILQSDCPYYWQDYKGTPCVSEECLSPKNLAWLALYDSLSRIGKERKEEEE